jgi:hypothetical protein
MNSSEIATRTPDQAFYMSDFSTHVPAEGGLSEHTNPAHLGDVDLLSEGPRHASLAATRRNTDISAGRLRSAFEQAPARA